MYQLRARTRITFVLALVGAAALAGCATSGIGHQRETISIDSSPVGAHVFVGGREIGVTPITVKLDDVFPRHWTTRVMGDEDGFAFFRRMEIVDIKKAGCETFTRRYVEQELNRDINIKLTCDPNYRPPAAAAPAVPLPKSVEERLKALEVLKRDGTITDDEYRAQRQRILDSM